MVANIINEDLECIRAWSERNLLKLNAKKTNALLISRYIQVEYPEIKIGNETIGFVDRATSLGFTVGNNFKWDSYVLGQCGKIYGSLRSLYTKASLLSTNVKLKLFKTFILPYFISCDFLFFNVSSNTQERLKVALNSCVRFVYNLKRQDHVTHLQHTLLANSFFSFF